MAICFGCMKIYQLSQIGGFHVNHNEDAQTTAEIDENVLIIAVADGCSAGKESHFASTLLVKIIRKIAKEIGYRDFVERRNKTIAEYLEEVMRRLFQDFGDLKNRLHLETEEVLSTLLLGVIDKQKQAAEIIVISDGLVCCNENFYEFEQDDKPDYLGYHLTENFDDWFKCQSQKLSFTNIKDLSISTDGIFTFRNFDGEKYEDITEQETIIYLLLNQDFTDNEKMLHKKTAEIATDFGLKPSDDLSIIRITFQRKA